MESAVPDQPIPIDAPTMADTVAGVVAWQQAGPQLRRASIQVTGHIVEVWATVLPDLSPRRIKFRMPFAAPEVALMLDDLVMGPPGRTAVVDGRETSDQALGAGIAGGDA